MPDTPTTEPQKRGFAAMDPAKREAASRLGGQQAHQNGTAHKFTSDQAKEAGRLGGIARQNKRREAVAIMETSDKD